MMEEGSSKLPEIRLDLEATAMEPCSTSSGSGGHSFDLEKSPVAALDETHDNEKDLKKVSSSSETALSGCLEASSDDSLKEKKLNEKKLLSNDSEKVRESKVKPTAFCLDKYKLFGVAQPGEVLAVLGSSGAGKSTLLNILSQRKMKGIRVEGAVRVNGLRVNGDFMQKISAYVEQEDVFIGSLTVREQLQFNALLRMGKKYSRREQNRRVEMVLKELGLLPVANTIISTLHSSGLSGGEKKRLSFASEILTSPPILLCDEPTSGLDSFLALQVVTVLKRLASRKRMTIVVTIHQPSSQVFQLFDRIYLMAEGTTAFCGTPSDANKFFEECFLPLPANFNPADHFISSLSVKPGRKENYSRNIVSVICSSYRDSNLGQAVSAEARTGEVREEGTRSSSEEGALLKNFHSENQYRHKYKSTWWQQLKILTWRDTITTLRDPAFLWFQLYQTIMISFLIGIIYLGTPLSQKTVMNINGAAFQLIVNMNFLFIFNVVRVFSVEVPVFLKENRSNLYRVDTYFLAKNISDFPVYTLYAVLFCSILYWMSGFVPRIDVFAVALLIAALVHHVALSIAYLVSCLFSTRAIATSVMPMFITPLLAFGGFYINVATLPAYFVPFKYFSHFYYGYEALSISQWNNTPLIPGCNQTRVTSLIPTCYSTGSQVLQRMSFSASNFYRDLIILGGFIVVLRIAAFIALVARARRG